MSIPVCVPRSGWSMEEGTFVAWIKKDGDLVRPGDALFVLETEKASEEIETLDGGLLRLLPGGPKPGDVVKVGQVLAYLLKEGENLPEVQPAIQAEKKSPSAVGSAAAPTAAPSAALADAERRHPAISPRARRLARQTGIDWQHVQGTGRHGRIRECDIGAAARTTLPGRVIAHTSMRRTIAARMTAGVMQAAPVTLTTRADAAYLVRERQELKQAGLAVSYTDMIVQRTARVLREHPMLQAQWRDDGLFVPECIHVAIAVDAPAGLYAPVLHNADRMSLAELAARSSELIGLARDSRLAAEHLRDATFTVTNLGMFGVDAFTPIIHLPQCAVLGVGRIVRVPAVVDDAVVPRDQITLSLTFDHRVVDGGPAARFLDAVRRSIEEVHGRPEM
jgi:pyruvate dehydrogenase E2 component (dihydrolipoyllysine-residue acetyltransferase)